MRTLVLALIALVMLWTIGCSKPISGNPPPLPSGHEGHDHDGHDHAGHSHAALGPNGGHLIELGDEQFHLEWVHDDDAGKLTVYVLDGNAKELVPIPAEKMTIVKKLGERTDSYDLVAVGRKGETPKSAKFEIVDKALIEALTLVGDGVEASITADINGKSFTKEFTKHEDHHGHKH